MSTALKRNFARDYESLYELDFDDLVSGRRAGHMGWHEYACGSLALWDEYINANKDQYYIPENEISLIKKAASLSCALVGNQPVTLVSRGCGTKFLAKEGVLLRHLLNVTGIVYIDQSEAALKQSLKEGQALAPKAWHKPIQADMYDLSLQYPVEGVELGTCFGLTFFNIEGFPNSLPPKNAYMRNLSAIRAQMKDNAHLIVTIDHNQDAYSIENAYTGQSEFAKDMLRRTKSLDPESVDFVVKFFEESQTLAHGFRFRSKQLVTTQSGNRIFHEGDILWFNNSVKPKIRDAKTWNLESGFTYARLDIQMDAMNRIGWHHLLR